VPPYCRCPAGTEEPNCTAPKSKAPPPAVPRQQCKPPRTGVPPYCRCPPGTEGPNCTPPFRDPR
jgi:hypothetical protein